MLKKFVIGPLGTNCYFYSDNVTGDSVVIDPAYPDERLLKMLSRERVRYILITHAHIDHIYGAAAVKELTGAQIVTHRLAAERLCNDDENLYNAFAGNIDGIYSGDFRHVTADITVDTGECIQVGKTVFSALHTPGHTSGSVSYLTQNEIFCGDFIFAGSYGRIDFPTGSFSDMTDSFRKLCSLDGDYIIYPGHQDSTTLKNERQFNPLTSYLLNDGLY